MANPVVHFEIMGTEGSALEKFYAELFGWNVVSNLEVKYGVVDTQAGEGINGGIGTTTADKPYVTFYIGVDDLQKTLNVIEKNGGKTVAPPMEIPGVVNFAQFADPAGNVLGLVTGGPEGATGPSKGSGAAVSWFEALGPDADALAAFYTKVFGWKAKRSESPDFVYHEVEAGPGGIAGGIGSSPDGAAHVNIYAAIPNLQETLDHANTLGAITIMPPMMVGEGTEIALFADPQGCIFGIYKHEH